MAATFSADSVKAVMGLRCGTLKGTSSRLEVCITEHSTAKIMLRRSTSKKSKRNSKISTSASFSSKFRSSKPENGRKKRTRPGKMQSRSKRFKETCRTYRPKSGRIWLENVRKRRKTLIRCGSLSRVSRPSLNQGTTQTSFKCSNLRRKQRRSSAAIRTQDMCQRHQ